MGVTSVIAMVREEEEEKTKRRTRCRVLRKKSRAGPSSTDDWVLVKRALCKIPVLPGGSLWH